jgi:hypothetical protein
MAGYSPQTSKDRNSALPNKEYVRSSSDACRQAAPHEESPMFCLVGRSEKASFPSHRQASCMIPKQSNTGSVWNLLMGSKTQQMQEVRKGALMAGDTTKPKAKAIPRPYQRSNMPGSQL